MTKSEGFLLQVFFLCSKEVGSEYVYILYYNIHKYYKIYIYIIYYILLQIYSQFPWELSIYHPPPRVVRKNAATCVRCLAEDLGNTGTDVTGAEWPPTLP